MKIYLKIGTMPATRMHLCNKHKLPEIGDLIKVKSENFPYIKKESVLIDDIKHLNGRQLFFGARF